MQQHDDDRSVQHLIELGYVDPEEIAARNDAVRRQNEAELCRAAELASQGKMQEAVFRVERLSADNPEWIAPRQLLAELRYRTRQFGAVQAQLDWLTYHGVEHPRLALIAGAMALRRREFQSALEELEYARHVEPKLPSVHTLYATVLLRLGRLDEAAEVFRRAVQCEPTDARAHDGLAAISLRQGRFDDAADWALQALEQNMQLFQAHYHLGLALARLNRPHEALQALETCARAEPQRGAPYRWLSRIAEDQLHDRALAARYQQRGREVIRWRRSRRRGEEHGAESSK
jgi:predicted Zn-dependent protease